MFPTSKSKVESVKSIISMLVLYQVDSVLAGHRSYLPDVKIFMTERTEVNSTCLLSLTCVVSSVSYFMHCIYTSQVHLTISTSILIDNVYICCILRGIAIHHTST